MHRTEGGPQKAKERAVAGDEKDNYRQACLKESERGLKNTQEWVRTKQWTTLKWPPIYVAISAFNLREPTTLPRSV